MRDATPFNLAHAIDVTPIQAEELQENQRDKERIVDEVPPPQSAGFGEETEEPFQTGALN